jgi:hypothetical protein
MRMKKIAQMLGLTPIGVLALCNYSMAAYTQHMTSSMGGNGVAVNATSEGARNANSVVFSDVLMGMTGDALAETASAFFAITPNGKVFRGNPATDMTSKVKAYGQIDAAAAMNVTAVMGLPGLRRTAMFDPVGKKIYVSSGGASDAMTDTPLLTRISNLYISRTVLSAGNTKYEFSSRGEPGDYSGGMYGGGPGSNTYAIAVDQEGRKFYNLLSATPNTALPFDGDALAPGSTIVNASTSAGVWSLSPSGQLYWLPYNASSSPVKIASGVKSLVGSMQANAGVSGYFVGSDNVLYRLAAGSPAQPIQMMTGVASIYATRPGISRNASGSNGMSCFGLGLLVLKEDKSAAYIGGSYGVWTTTMDEYNNGFAEKPIPGTFSKIVSLPFGQAGLMDESGHVWAPAAALPDNSRAISLGYSGVWGYTLTGAGLIDVGPLASWFQDPSGVYIERTAGGTLEFVNPYDSSKANQPIRSTTFTKTSYESLMSKKGYRIQSGGAVLGDGNSNRNIAIPGFMSIDSDDIWFDHLNTFFGLKGDGTLLTGRAQAPVDGNDACWYSDINASQCAFDGSFHEILPMAMPTGVVASNATSNDSVEVKWNGVAGLEYAVYYGPRSGNPASFTLAGKTAAGASTYKVTGLQKGTKYDFYVVGERLQLGSSTNKITSQISAIAGGATANGPESVSGKVTVASNSKDATVDLSVVIRDSNPVLTYSLSGAAPSHGTVIVDKNVVKYTPSKDYIGADQFGVTVTDAAGNSVSGVAEITVECTAPSLVNIAVPSKAGIQYSLAQSSIGYTSDTCNGGSVIKTELFNNKLEKIEGYDQESQAADGTNIVVGYNTPDLPAGSYVVKSTIVSKNTQKTDTKTSAPFHMYALALPALNIVSGIKQQEEDLFIANIAAKASGCAPTTSVVTAKADPSKCLVEWNTLPAPLAKQPSLGVSGYVIPSANQLVSADVSVFDSKGNKYPQGAVSAYVEIQKTTAPVFGVKAPEKINKFFDWITVSLTKQTGGMDCSVTTDVAAAKANTLAAAQANNPSGTKACVVEFKAEDLPKGLLLNKATNAPELTGRVLALGQSGNVINYKVSKVVAGSDPVAIGNGQIDLNVLDTALNGTLSASLNPVGASVQTTTVKVATPRTGVGYCPAYTGVETSAVLTTGKQGPLTCLVDWTNPPPGMTVGADTETPSLEGKPTVVGANGIHADVFVVYDKGNGVYERIPVGTGLDLPLQVNEPAPPAFQLTLDPSVKKVSYAGKDVYLVNDTGILGNVIVTTANLASAKLTSDQSGTGTVVTNDLKQNDKVKVVQGIAPAAWAIRQQNLKLSYNGLAVPLESNKELTTVQLPSSKLGVQLTSNLVNLSKTDDIILAGAVGIAQKGSSTLSYDKTKDGGWVAYLGDATDPSNIARLSEKVVVGADGKVNLPAVKYEALTGRKVVVVAEPDTDIPNQIKLVSTVAKPMFVKTDELTSAKVEVKFPSGPAPFSGALKLALSAEDDEADGDIQWYMSSDGGAKYDLQSGASGRMPKITLTMPGQYKVRATVANKYSGKTFTTEPIDLTAYDNLVVKINGPDLSLVGNEVKLVADAKSGSGISNEFDYNWTVVVPGNDPVVSTDPQINLNITTATEVNVTLKAKPKALRAEDPASWSSASRKIVFTSPKLLPARIAGAPKIETDSESTFKATVALPWKSKSTPSFNWKGVWVLPDGTEIAGKLENGQDKLIWSPTEADWQKPQPITLGYKQSIVDVNGSAVDSLTVFTSTAITITKYEWPNFAIKATCDSSMAPALCDLAVTGATEADTERLKGKVLSYAWDVGGLEAKSSTNKEKIKAMINAPGSYPVSVTISDKRGNTSVATLSVDSATFKPFDMTLQLRPTLRYNRNPMTFRVVPTITGGHKKDRIAKYALFVDGTPIELNNSSVAPKFVVIPEAGTHEVKLSVDSAFGNSGSTSTSVVVNQNKTPTCTEIRGVFDNTAKRFSFRAVGCRDEDGKLKKTEWDVNGVRNKSTSPVGSVSLEEGVDVYEVKLMLTDDSGEVGELTKQFTRPSATN